MNTRDIYELAVEKGIETDFRSEDKIEDILERRKEEYEELDEDEKENFDQEKLDNPYSDTRILNLANEEQEIENVLVGIDITPADILLADKKNIDLVIGHHPMGKALANMSDVMKMQIDIFKEYGVPVNIVEGYLKEKQGKLKRALHSRNHWKSVDMARQLGINLICTHTPTDNMVADFLREKVENIDPYKIEDIMDMLDGIDEYQNGKDMGVGPQVFSGDKDNRAGNVAVTGITGGTSGPNELYKHMANAGIGTVLAMHLGEESREEAKNSKVNVVVAGHMSSDSIGMNLFLDELEKEGINIEECGGFYRNSRI